MFTTLKETFKDAFSLKMDIASPEEIHNAINSGAKVKGTNMCILILAILIASIGLNMNSTAVIIGAMLISPLMGGIMAIGYGIAVNDLKSSKNAAIGLAFQVIICIITSTVYFTISPISTAHSELLARTSPSVWDVLIAICGGLAGIIGVTRKEKTNVIPGVAIATALMPPLCTAGYGLATHQIRFFLGAVYLFFINSFFICLTTIIIIKILKLPCKKFINAKAKRKLYLNISLIAVITIIPSVIFAYQLIAETITDKNIEQYMSKEFSYSDTQIVQSYVNSEKNEIEVALIGKQLDSNEISRLEKALSDYGLSKMTLKITQPNLDGVITADDLQKYLQNDQNTESDIAIALKDNEISGLKEQLKIREKELEEYKKYDYDIEDMRKELRILYPEIKDFSIGPQKGCTTDGSESYETVLVTLKTTINLSDEEKYKITNWFRVKTSESVITLIVQPEEEQIIPPKE